MVPFPQPRSLTTGSVLAVAAPSGPFDREAFDAGVAWLRRRYEVRFDEGVFSSEGFLAGDDMRRLAELEAAVADPEVDAILCARGGYGATRLLPHLDPSVIGTAGKLLVGFSDATALHALWARAGVRSFHAPMVTSLGKAPDDVRKRWVTALETGGNGMSWEVENIVDGTALGRLFGGNLALLTALLGTPFAPPVDGCLLFLEDVGERPYRVDRMLTSLAQAGWFTRCSGVVLGAFTEGAPGADGVSVENVLEERLGRFGIPVAKGLPIGHIRENDALPLGALARLSDGQLEILS